VNLNFLRIAPPEGEQRFRFIDGVRTLCLSWITTFHVIFYASFFVTAAESVRLFTAWQSRWVLRGHFALDALFVLTGFLIGYYLLVDADKGRLSYGLFLLRRAARLVPAYLVILLLYHFTMNFNIETVWANLLFVNNYVPLIHQTMSWSWSLPVDVHFYFLFPILLLFVRNRAQHLLNALWIVFGVLVVVRGFVELSANVSPPLFANPHGSHAEQEVFNHYFDTIYDKTHTRIGAIVCGLMVATLVRYHHAEEWLAKHPVTSSVLFVIAVVLGVGVLAAPVLQGEAASYDPTWAAIYLICYNYAFALAVATVILVLLGQSPLGRPVRAALSHPLWYVPSELCYGVFLLNPMVVLGLYAYVIRKPTISAPAVALYAILAIVCTFACAYVLYIVIERPFRSAGKQLARRLERRATSQRSVSPIVERTTEPASAILHD
jgi:peptidoglycan/LPS O-acetylase OafA/YrhL